MVKYLKYDVVFQEIPGEFSYAVKFSGYRVLNC